jgi:hypothetical protein
MLRRAALLACLLAPVAAAAQTFTVTPAGPFGDADCAAGSTTHPLTLNWTVATAPSGTNQIYEVRASQNLDTSCASGNVVTGAGAITATSATQSFPPVGTLLHPLDLLTQVSGLTSCPAAGTNTTIYLCVRLCTVACTAPVSGGVATGNILFQNGPPAIPVISVIKPADGALWVYWSPGTGGSVAAASYTVSAAAVNSIQDVFTHEQAGITDTSYRLGGLNNGVKYSVTVKAISVGGNASDPSTAIEGTPQPVDGFWEIYQGAGGREQGGCGGPAGAASLLGLAALLGAMRLQRLRRRS